MTPFEALLLAGRIYLTGIIIAMGIAAVIAFGTAIAGRLAKR